MNCQSCNTRIDYLYLTNCADCGCAIDAIGASQQQPLPEPPPLEAFQKRLTWKRRLVNVGYVFFSASSFMLTGATIVVFVSACLAHVIIDILDPVQMPGEYCRFGQALGLISIVVGGFLGTMFGTVIAVKRPIYRAESH
jgi:hypothetical protein